MRESYIIDKNYNNSRFDKWFKTNNSKYSSIFNRKNSKKKKNQS